MRRGSQSLDSIEAALRRLDVSLAVAVRWQATWVMMSLVVLVTQVELGMYYNTTSIHTSRSCRVEVGSDNTPSDECLAAARVVPFTSQVLLLDVLGGLNSVLTVLLLASIAKYHHSQYLIKKLSDVEPVSLPFYASSVFPGMLAECGLCAIHVFPGVDHVISNVHWRLVLVFAQMLRVYVIGRFRFHHSTMGQAPGRFIASLTNTHLNLAFLVRSLLEYTPYSVVGTVFCASLIIAAYMLRLSETWLCTADPLLQCVPLSFTDSVWVLFVSVTTVGYGSPYVAFTVGGRAVTILLSLISFLVLAVVVAFAIRWMKLHPTQTIVLAFISRHKQLGLLQTSAAKAIQVAWRYQRMYKQSIEWKQAHGGLAYRGLSRRLPMEHHYLRTLAEWARQRNKVAQLAIDGDANYKWLLTNKVNQQVQEVQATIQKYWERVLPPHIRRQFDNHLLGLPLDYEPSVSRATIGMSSYIPNFDESQPDKGELLAPSPPRMAPPSDNNDTAAQSHGMHRISSATLAALAGAVRTIDAGGSTRHLTARQRRASDPAVTTPHSSSDGTGGGGGAGSGDGMGFGFPPTGRRRARRRRSLPGAGQHSNITQFDRRGGVMGGSGAVTRAFAHLSREVEDIDAQVRRAMVAMNRMRAAMATSQTVLAEFRRTDARGISIRAA